MVDKVWVGKKVQVLSLEELEKNHFKDEEGYFHYRRKIWSQHGDGGESYYTKRLKYGNVCSSSMRKFCGKVCEITQVEESSFKIKEDSELYFWCLWMVKEPVTIEDILEAE